MRTKKTYNSVSIDDGKRVFVDRLWPIGIKKDKAFINEWLKIVFHNLLKREFQL
jgi:uncharacterized protein YeaO (DUF488 family)